jgi:AraC-like DNA-binding protein
MVPGGLAFVIDNEQPFRVAFDPTRRMRLYSLRIPRAALGPTTRDTIRRADETVTSSESGRHLATQMSLLATMIDIGAVKTASLMSPVVVDLVRSVLHPGDRNAPTRLARLMDISRSRLTDPGFDLAALARESNWSIRTVQTAFSAEGLSFSDWLAGERLELARAMLTDPVWETRGIAHVAYAAGFTDTSTFFRTFRRRFGTTPGSARQNPSTASRRPGDRSPGVVPGHPELHAPASGNSPVPDLSGR